MQTQGVSAVVLKTLPFFQGMDNHKLEAVGQMAALRRVGRGAMVLSAGKHADHVCFVLGGSLKMLVSDEDGREVILGMLGPGDMFGEMGVVDEMPLLTTVSTMTPVDLVMIGCADFRCILEDNFNLALRIVGTLSRRLREAERKIEALALMDVYGRVARLLFDMADNSSAPIIVRTKITKQDIAKMIGASREMVSRVMKDLQNRGLIQETEVGVVLHEGLRAGV